MSSIAIIDLDTYREGDQAENIMVVNNSERARIARLYADRFTGREQTNAFYAKMFDPDLVQHDVIEELAKEQLACLEARGARIVYLTSRPHTMSKATEFWLFEQQIEHPCHFKFYGTDQLLTDGKIDTGDRYMKTTLWKAREVKRIISEAEAGGEEITSVLFVDDEEVNRAAVAALNDPRILIRCSLQDAVTHDFQRHYEIESDTRPFLRRLRELASILEMREEFEKADQCQLTIEMPQIPGHEEERHTSVMIESWRAAAYAPGVDDPDLRYYRYNELYPQRNEMSEIEQIISLQVCCDQDGRVLSVKMAKPGAGVSLLNELEDKFDPETAQSYADEWVAHSIEEFGYVEGARAQRGIQLFGKAALADWVAHVQKKNEEIKAALHHSGVKQ